jgi:trimethylamine-N-oxide reductase cytochrome c-type subunit TorC
VLAKIKATKDLFYTHVSPSIDTPEKFETKRAAMAQKIWHEMKATDSHQCRSCEPAELFEADAAKL